MLKFISLLLLIVIVIMPASAQNESASPLLDMLALVPDSEGIRRIIISYADYRAVEAARGIETPTMKDFQSDENWPVQWMAAARGIVSGTPEYLNLIRYEDTPEVVGFAFDDVQRSLQFGYNTQVHGLGGADIYGLLLEGDFDTTRIIDSFLANEFILRNFDGITVLCNPNGCEKGQEISRDHSNSANPFGGYLGRRQPLALLPGMLVSSPLIGIVEDVLSAYRGEQSTLADAPDYRAVAHAAAEHGTINQIQFVNPLDLMTVDSAAMLPSVSPELVEQLMNSVTLNPLPEYSLAAFADVWDGSEQRALIMLVYAEEAEAQTAADALVERMDTYVEFSTGITFDERMADIGATVDAPAVYTDADTGTSVAIWSMRYPMPSNEPEGDEDLTTSSLGYVYLISAFYKQDLNVLALESVQAE